MWRFAILLIGCGRIDFGVVAGAAAPDAASDAGPVSLADHMPCAMPVLLDSGGHLPHDVLAWVNDAHGDWLVGVEHEDQDVHQIHRHAITAPAGTPVAGPAELVLAVDHVDVLSFEPVGDSYVLGYDEFVLQTAQTLMLTPDMVSTASHPLGMLAAGNPPLARAGNGGLAMIGITNSLLEVVGLDETGAPIAGASPSFLTMTPADGPGHPTMIALDDGLAAVWDSNGTCKLAKLRPDLSIAAGPVDVSIPGCSDPHVAWLPSARRIIVVASDTANGNVAGGVWDTSLAPITPPTTLATSAQWIRILGDTDTAWIAWVDNEPNNLQQVRSGRLSADGRIIKMNDPVGSLDATLGHFHQIWRAGQTPVVVWTDTVQGRTFSAMRLCP